MTITRACCALALLVTTACAGFVLWAAYGFDREYATWAAALDGAVVSLGALLLTGVGVLIVLRGQGHVIGRVQVLSGLGMITNVAGYSAQTLYLEGMRPPWTHWVAWLGSWTWTFMLLGVWLTFLLFPDGRATGRTARYTVVVAVAVTAALILVLPFRRELADVPGVPNPIPPVPVITALSDPVYAVLDPLLYVLFPVSLFCLALRYRRAGPDVRAQIRWLGWVALVTVLGMSARLVVPPPWWDAVDVVKLFTLLLLPLVVAVSVLRYRLYDVDRLLSRTVSYALLTGVLVAVYVGVVGLAGQLVPEWSGSVGVAAATLAAVSLVRPLRRVVQVAVDRRFDRARHDAHRTVAGYADRLRSPERSARGASIGTERSARGASIDSAPDRDFEADLLHVLDRTVAPTTAWLWQPERTLR